MKSSTALRKARRKIASGDEQFVCCALQYSGGEDTEVSRNLQSMFSSGSQHGNLVDHWLEDTNKGFRKFREAKYYNSRSSKDYAEYFAAMKDYRLRWIDWMIEGYEAKGD